MKTTLQYISTDNNVLLPTHQAGVVGHGDQAPPAHGEGGGGGVGEERNQAALHCNWCDQVLETGSSSYCLLVSLSAILMLSVSRCPTYYPAQPLDD